MNTGSRPMRERGMTIIETMIGLTIGLLTVLIVYQVYGVAERYKRNTTTSGDAQTTGVFSMFALQREIGNAGAGIAVNTDDLLNCRIPAPGAAQDRGWPLRSVPVLIGKTGAGTDADSDTVTVYYGASNTIVTPALFTAVTAAGGPSYRVQSPVGFNPAGGELVVAVSPTTGQCARSRTTGVVVFDVVNGLVDVSIAGGAPFTVGAGSKLINLGPEPRVQRLLFDVDPATNALRSTDLICPGGGCVPNPLASNIMLFKAQYGIDTNADGVLDTWVRPDPPWDVATLTNPNPANPKALAQQINQIKAVRIAVVVRGDEPDPNLKGAANDFTRKIFADCPTAACTTEDIDVLIAQQPNYGWRYRVYETIVPLRNAIWNPVSP
jgi:type IV pilus assembly protein PilW